ncbi:hypothetical protein RN001_001185 [Aquatica leii]|uniref:Cytochrome b-c1 complex subunit 7 n=1 Tax=Aquatica leii TaxID=1421715 RepID=A0AAN7Q3R5_9COLE|nr:hypothetical protein RN001_001185 [Aquatica leii]
MWQQFEIYGLKTAKRFLFKSSILTKMAVQMIQKRFMSSALQRFCYNLAGFNKYGLMRDDLLHEDDDNSSCCSIINSKNCLTKARMDEPR